MSEDDKTPRKFSTNNANYVLNNGRHSRETNTDSYKIKPDALVLETGFRTYEELCLNDFKGFKQYSKLINDNLKSKAPKSIFFVDMPPKKWFREQEKEIGIGYPLDNIVDILPLMSPIFFHEELSYLTLPLSAPLISYCLGPVSDYYSKYSKLAGCLSLSRFFTNSGFRSAASAKKMEEFVVPEIRKRKADEVKPTVLADFGGAHSDLEIYLKYKNVRNFTVNFHKYLKLNSRDNSYLNKVCELRPKNSEEPRAIDKIIFREDEAGSEGWERIIYRI